MPHDRIIDLYEETAREWDEVRNGGPAPNEAPHLAAFAAGLRPGAAVLDIGCGSGVPVARDLIASGFEVTGIDSSASLIALCRERFPAAEWQVADMRTLDLERRFDGLIAWHSFFHLSQDDQRAMFPVFARHAAPGALLTFTCGPFAGESVGEWQGEPLYHASLSQEEYRALLEAHGFTDMHFTPGKLGEGPFVWVARKSGSDSASPQEREAE